ncbi:MAG TPA: response regulator [Terriglobales bacterium]|nr:response regulator [Terriglobales bacterium]
MKTGARFRRRILLVDSHETLLQGSSDALLAEGYEVITARNGFEALTILRGAHPDLLVTELNLPHMSGFELLSVVRKRFPLISVIATSGEYTAITLPHKAICDVFVPKSTKFLSELVGEAGTLISESPIRASQPKARVAPVWIPRSAAGYIVLTCPECLRSFSTSEPKSICARDVCVFCGTDVPFRMGGPPTTAHQRSMKARQRADKVLARSRKLRTQAPG